MNFFFCSFARLLAYLLATEFDAIFFSSVHSSFCCFFCILCQFTKSCWSSFNDCMTYSILFISSFLLLYVFFFSADWQSSGIHFRLRYFLLIPAFLRSNRKSTEQNEITAEKWQQFEYNTGIEAVKGVTIDLNTSVYVFSSLSWSLLFSLLLSLHGW